MVRKKWEDLVIEQVANKFEPTFLGVDQPRVGLEEQPNFKVYEFSPNRKLDGDQRYLLAGPEWQIMLQTSLLKVGHDILGDRLGFNFTFEDWFSDWAEGFKWGINRTGNKAGITTNYPIRKTGDKEGWREDIETRPVYLEWKNPNPKLNKNYRVIEYFSTGKDGESVVFHGSDRDIAQQIVNWEWQKSGSGSSDVMGKGGYVRRRGQPQIVLWFLEDMADVEPGYDQVEGRISFRIMDKTDDPERDLPKLTTADMQQWGNKIKELFLPGDTPYVWKKGKEMVSYANWQQGYQFQLNCRNKTDGIELVQKLVQIQNHTYTPKYLNHSVPEAPTDAFPTIPSEVTIAGRKTRAPRRRPIADVTFRYAKLYTYYWKEPIILVNNKGQVLPHWEEDS